MTNYGDHDLGQRGSANPEKRQLRTGGKQTLLINQYQCWEADKFGDGHAFYTWCNTSCALSTSCYSYESLSFNRLDFLVSLHLYIAASG